MLVLVAGSAADSAVASSADAAADAASRRIGRPSPAERCLRRLRRRGRSAWESASSAPRASSVRCSASSSEDGTSMPQSGHARLHPADHRLDDLDPPVALVLRRDDVPRRQRAVGQAQHVVDRLVVLRSLLAVAPVLVGQLPRLERDRRARRSKRRSCSSCEMCIQSLITTMPSSASECSKSLISS